MGWFLGVILALVAPANAFGQTVCRPKFKYDANSSNWVMVIVDSRYKTLSLFPALRLRPSLSSVFSPCTRFGV